MRLLGVAEDSIRRCFERACLQPCRCTAVESFLRLFSPAPLTYTFCYQKKLAALSSGLQRLVTGEDKPIAAPAAWPRLQSYSGSDQCWSSAVHRLGGFPHDPLRSCCR